MQNAPVNRHHYEITNYRKSVEQVMDGLKSFVVFIIKVVFLMGCIY